MRKLNLLTLVLATLSIGMIFNACKKDEEKTPAITGEALFTYVADGKTVTFTNTSTVSGSVTYLWDFGDGETSTEKDPVHTYVLKGEYNVTLTVTDSQGGTHPVSTKINVDKKTRIDLTDDSFDDWNVVTEPEYVVPLGDNSGVVKVAKFDYDANFIYAYIEFEGNIGDEHQYDIFFDYDNDSTTGFTSYLWPSSGGDYLVEIAPFTGGDLGIYTFDFSGVDGTEDWNWTEEELLADAVVVGKVAQVGANVVAELGFSRSKIPGLDGDEVALGNFISNSDWAEIGFAPDATQEGGPHQAYFVLDMK